MVYQYNYPRAAVTVDAIVFGVDGGAWQVLLVERAQEPFKGTYAIPGGFVDMDETLEQAALRELAEETGITLDRMEQLMAFDAVDRDPRGRTITMAHYAVVAVKDHGIKAGSDAKSARWFPVNNLPTLAFDHADILKVAIGRVVDKDGA
jgi:8-oxo-dGTP diphosphatase